MVDLDHEKQRARYLSHADGAPPVPPPGGYRGARRSANDLRTRAAGAAPTVEMEPVPRQPASTFSIIALVAAALFGVLLLILLIGGVTNIFYGVGMVTAQLAVLAVAIAAVCTKRGRTLGAAALTVVLLLNIASVGALSALQTSANGTYAGQKTTEQKHEEAYPGIKDIDPNSILRQPSLEEVKTAADDLMAAIRARLSEKFPVTWVAAVKDDARPERNGYGGESMLKSYTSTVWATKEPMQDYDDKVRVMDAVNEVLDEFSMQELYAFNDPTVSSDSADIMTKFYGSADPRTQHTWEGYGYDWANNMVLYVDIFDLSKDASGDFLKERTAQNTRTGEPLEGIQVFVTSKQLLSADDRDAFEKKLQEYDPSF